MTPNRVQPLTDEAICSAIATGGDARLRAIEVIYRWSELKVKVMHYVQTHGGSRSEAIDIFHDGIIALDRNIRAGAYQPTSSLQGYLYSICRFCWNNEYRRRKKVRPTAIEDFQMAPDAITPEITLRAKEETELLEQVLALLDTSCRKIMTLWKLSYSMAEIASEMNLSSPELAKKYRYRCMQKLMDNLQHHPHLLNALKNG